MFAIGRGFSHRRKSSPKSPRDLHIRKISLSGCSVGSWDSASSTCSSAATPTMPTFASPPRTGGSTSSSGSPRASFENNPLGLHSPHQAAPKRLKHRAYLQSEQRRAYTAPPMSGPSTFFDDAVTEDEDDVGYGFAENDAETMELHEEQPKTMDLPPGASPLDHDSHERNEPQDYFFFQLSRRPPMPRSHWSESTIQTLHSFDDFGSGACTPAVYDDEEEEEEQEPDMDEEVVDEAPAVAVAEKLVVLPNFSKKRPVAPQRPSVQALVDQVDEESKTARWKRRGVVFNKDEACDSSSGSDTEGEF